MLGDPNNLKAGDVVKPRGGGPKMTVVREIHYRTYECIWFKKGECNQVNLPGRSLVKLGIVRRLLP